MNKIWFIQIQGRQEGPYSAAELRHDPRVTPDTLVWKKGFKGWVPIRKVPELKDIFNDSSSLEDLVKLKKTNIQRDRDEIAIDMNKDLSPFWFWLFVILILSLVLYLRYGS